METNRGSAGQRGGVLSSPALLGLYGQRKDKRMAKKQPHQSFRDALVEQALRPEREKEILRLEALAGLTNEAIRRKRQEHFEKYDALPPDRENVGLRGDESAEELTELLRTRPVCSQSV